MTTMNRARSRWRLFKTSVHRISLKDLIVLASLIRTMIALVRDLLRSP